MKKYKSKYGVQEWTTGYYEERTGIENRQKIITGPSTFSIYYFNENGNIVYLKRNFKTKKAAKAHIKRIKNK